MPRLRSSATGVVINVSDETAARLSSDFTPVEEPKKTATRKASASKSASTKSDEK